MDLYTWEDAKADADRDFTISIERQTARDEYRRQRGIFKVLESVPAPNLPWNWNSSGCVLENTSIEEAARAAGWLKTIATDSLWKWISSRLFVNWRGFHNPYQRANIWAVIHNNPSPQRFLKQFLAVRNRASVILKPFGLEPSWSAMGAVSENGLRKTGRTAHKVASYTVNQHLRSQKRIPSYGPDRTLADFHGFTEFMKLPEAAARFVGYNRKSGESLSEAMARLNIAEAEVTGLRVRWYGESRTRFGISVRHVVKQAWGSYSEDDSEECDRWEASHGVFQEDGRTQMEAVRAVLKKLRRDKPNPSLLRLAEKVGITRRIEPDRRTGPVWFILNFGRQWATAGEIAEKARGTDTETWRALRQMLLNAK